MNGDIGFMILCSALVLLMTPGLAFFYGGFVPRKNALNTMMMSVFVMGIGVIMWFACGYAFSFGGEGNPFVAGEKFFFLRGVESFADGETTAPYEGILDDGMLFCMFQMMFSVITCAIITGSLVGKIKFTALFAFVPIWLLLVYYPLAHMVWGGGLLDKIGSIDFAGGNVVHISSGTTGLVLAILMGKKRTKIEHRPHNIPFILLGAALLLFGWFGFNAGSGLHADGLAVHAFATTALSSCAALFSWMVVEWFVNKKPTLIGAATGLVVGLVAITPGAGFVSIPSALLIGLLVSPVCYFAVSVLKKKIGYDDTLDAFGCHGIGGIYGGIMTGIFTLPELNETAGLAYGGGVKLLGAQLGAIGITLVWTIAGALIAYFVVKLFVKSFRVGERDERIGLDLSEHGETAYPAFNGID